MNNKITSLSVSEMALLSRLLEEALLLDETDRNAWLGKLAPEYKYLAQSLHEALWPKNSTGSSYNRLATFPKLGLAPEIEPTITSGLQAGTHIGPYELIRLLGIGGMAEVWLARRADGAFKREVALKLPRLTWMRKDLEQRFLRERDILASLEHPNIAHLYDAGIDPQGLPYFALEYVVGTPITQYCDDQRLSVGSRLGLFHQVLGAVQYAHANLVIHRDLKPANILVTAGRQVKLLDFGIAKLLTDGEARETELTLASGRALTVDYAAPEQITGSPLTIAADVYALGVVLYELLAGQRPYVLKRGSRAALEEAILQTEPTVPSRIVNSEAADARGTSVESLARTIRGDLDTVVFKALKKTPGDRYATAIAFDEDISRFLRGEVVLAQRDSTAYRVAKFTRRHWIAMSVVSLLILTLMGGLIATAYEARIASVQRDAALKARSRALTEAAAGRLKEGDVATALGVIFEVLRPQIASGSYTPEALNVFQEARAADLQALAVTELGRVRTVAFSPDGKKFVTAAPQNSARVLDAASGRLLLILAERSRLSTSAMFSPDSKRIITASLDKTAQIWDASTGRQLLLLSGHTGLLYSAAFSPDGKRVVTASADESARIWDAESGRQLRLLSGHSGAVIFAAFSPDGKRVVTALDDKSAQIWDAATGRQLLRLTGHDSALTSAAFSPDGKRIITSSVDKTARIWDAATGRQLLVLSGHSTTVWSGVFSADGQRIVTASADGSARIWDAATGKQLLGLTVRPGGISSAVFSPDARRILTGSTDKSARIWDIAGGELVLIGHTDRVSSATFSPDGKRIVTASDDKTVRIWDAAAGPQLRLLSGHASPVSYAEFSPDGKRIVSASFDQCAIWDAATGEQLRLTGHDSALTSAAFSRDGKRIITASVDNSAQIWDAATGRKLMPLSGHTGTVTFATYSPDNMRIATASLDKTARLWDAATGKQLLLLTGHSGELDSVAFSPDGRQIVTASDDNTARIWDTATGKQLRLLSGHTDGVSQAEFSPDGRQIVTASDDNTARIWDAATGKQLRLLSGHTGTVSYAEFSPDGKQIVTASFDKSVRIWDARVLPLETQILWAEAAQLDPLASAERSQLGLPAPTDVREWPAGLSKCHESAAAPYDPDRRAAGLMIDQIIADVALTACVIDPRNTGYNEAQLRYQHGRALVAMRNIAAARKEFEQALASGYRSAAVDLAILLSEPSAGMLDVPRAIALYQQAWKRGVLIAGFELGRLYETGVADAAGKSYLLSPDSDLSWDWYQRAATAGEPNALARLAERADSTAALHSRDSAKNNSFLLESFKYYAAAAERARMEDWPDRAWKNWRYHRASLARLLEHQGMMQEVASTYDNVRTQYTSPPPTLWTRLTRWDD